MYLTLFPTKVNILVYLGTSHRVATPTPPPPSILCCPDLSRPSTPGPFTHLIFPRPHLTPTSPPLPNTVRELHLLWPIVGLTCEEHSSFNPLKELCPSCNQTINLHLPTLYTFCTYLTSKPDMRTHGIVRLFQHCYSNLSFFTSILLNVFISLDPKPDY